ncbi:MAG TPA: VWA domain-containing protein [Acidobacteriaceae bacterium]|nr:VWA domain-containing protein [Acidobacteriaceae bacterium]
MMKLLGIAAVGLAAQLALGQGTPQETIRLGSTLVVAPTLVETTSGELVSNLQSADFLLTDNGVEQKVTVEESGRQPVAVVVLLQIGGAARRQFQNYRGLATMLDYATAGFARQVAMVTFDSRPEEASDFTANVDDLKQDLTHPSAGDGGAAILDAVDYGIGLLDHQPAGTRKVLLLVSQTHDDGSEAKAEAVIHRLGETNTTIYSLTFSPEKAWLKDQFTRPVQPNPLYTFSPDYPPLLNTFNLDGPVRMALGAMRTNAAAEVATLSGGESLPFTSGGDLDRQLSLLANQLPNYYTLTFRPSSQQPGLHALHVQVLHQPEPVTVKARTSYWATGPK